MNKIKPNRGEIWLIDLNPVQGREQAKKRPCLIISNNTYNHGPAELVVILPITSKDRQLPWHLEVLPGASTGLQKHSFIMCDQPRTVSKLRFEKKPLGAISSSILYSVQKRLGILLDFY